MFKVGDKVRCVDDRRAESYLGNHITTGSVYKVRSVDSEFVQLEVDDVGLSARYYARRFELVQEPDGAKAAVTSSLPVDSAARKEYPMAEGLLYYFPSALAAVAHVSYLGNQKHNPGEPLHHSRGKSMDHEDCIVRHSVDAAEAKTGGERTEHMASRAWRALAALQEHLESLGAPMAPNARVDK